MGIDRSVSIRHRCDEWGQISSTAEVHLFTLQKTEFISRQEPIPFTVKATTSEKVDVLFANAFFFFFNDEAIQCRVLISCGPSHRML